MRVFARTATGQRLLAWALLIVMLAPAGALAQTDGGPAGPDDLAAAEDYFAAQLRDARVPGGAFAVVRGGEVLHTYGFGRADAEGTPVTESTPFVIGSVSKSFTALAVMQLVDEGAIDLEAPVRTYLPWFEVADPDAGAAITIRRLLNQTSGFDTATGVYSLRGEHLTLEGQVRALADADTAAPGTYRYSNANYQVLGAVVEAVAGERFGDHLQERVFAPLGMHDSSATTLEEAQVAGLSDGHRLFFGLSTGATPFYRDDHVPSAFIVSTARDLGRYAAAHLDGGTIDGTAVVSAEAVALMHEGVASVPGPGGAAYGMGWFSGSNRGLEGVWHSGSQGDQQAVVILLPDKDVGVVALYNATSTLYEVFQKLDAITWGLASVVSDVRPSGTVTRMYEAFVVLVIVVTASQVRRIVRLARRRPPKRRRRTLSPRARTIATWAGTATSAASGMLLLLGVPMFLAAPWTILVRTDLGLWLGIAAVGELVIAGLRLRNTLRPGVAAPAEVALPVDQTRHADELTGNRLT